MESDGLVEDTVQIKDKAESSLERLRFDLSTVAEDATLSNIPLSEIYGLDVNEDLVLNELYKAHMAKTTIQDKEIEEMADSILSKMWNCEDSISFATSLRTHGQNFRRIATRSIGELRSHRMCVLSWHNFSICSRRVGPMQFVQESVRD